MPTVRGGGIETSREISNEGCGSVSRKFGDFPCVVICNSECWPQTNTNKEWISLLRSLRMVDLVYHTLNLDYRIWAGSGLFGKGGEVLK